MEIFFGFVFIVLGLVWLALPFYNLIKLNAYKKENESLWRNFYKLENELFQLRKAAPSEEDVSPASVPRAALEANKSEDIRLEDDEILERPETNLAEEKTISEDNHNKNEHNKNEAKSKPKGFEENFVKKLAVWIGAISIIIAGFSFIKYSMDNGWLGPVARTIASGLFGGALLVAGQFIAKRPQIANFERISQGVIGAGIVTLYFCFYAGVNLYHFIPNMIGFGGMAGVTAIAVILSLRHGQPIAIFGLIGGLLTPYLIGSDDPNPILLFSYLFVLMGGLLHMFARQGWWQLAIGAVIGSYLYVTLSVFHAPIAVEYGFVIALYVIALCGLCLLLTGKSIAKEAYHETESRHVSALNMIAITGATIAIFTLSAHITLSLFDWSMLGLLSLALMALSYFDPKSYQPLLTLKLASSLIFLSFWLPGNSFTAALLVIAGISAIYIGGSYYLMRLMADPRYWALVQTCCALALYAIAYFTLQLPESLLAIPHLWGMLSAALAVIAAQQCYRVYKDYAGKVMFREHLLGIYSLCASAFISLGLAVEMPFEYLAIAFCVQIAVTAYIYKLSDIHYLKHIIFALTTVMGLLLIEQFVLFLSLILNSLFMMRVEQDILNLVAAQPIITLGIPAALLGLSFYILQQRDGHQDSGILSPVTQVIFAMAYGLLLGCIYYCLRGLFHGGDYITGLSQAAGYIERGFITIAFLAIAIATTELLSKYKLRQLEIWGISLFRLCIARFIYFDLLLLNPLFSRDQFVGEWVLLNGITLVFGFILLSLGWALYNKNLFARLTHIEKSYQVIALITIFALVSLNIRQAFQGGELYLNAHTIGELELYSYSAIWLLMGIAMLGAGIKYSNKSARMISLAFIAMTILKVFLIDAGNLEGLYRILSFLGLGLSLLGLSYVYTKFVLEDTSSAEKQSAESEV